MESVEKPSGKMCIKVSVIIPIYNVEKYIEECLESVRNQTLKDIEIICVNDGSLDNSMEIVREKGLLDSRIHIVEQKNAGLSAARNKGLEQAYGEYVIFLDSDDALVDNALEVLYEKMSGNQLQQLFFEAKVIYDSPQIKRKYYRKYHHYYHRRCEYPQVLTGMEMLSRFVKNKEYRMSACLQMFERQLLVENGLQFREGIFHEDHLYTPQVMIHASRVMVLKEALYIRRLRDASIMLSTEKSKSSWGYYICFRELSALMQQFEPESEACHCLKTIAEQARKQAVVMVQNYEKEALLQELAKDYDAKEVAAYEEAVWNSDVMRKQQKIWAKIKYKVIEILR